MEARLTGLISREFNSVTHVNETSFKLNALLTGEVPEEFVRTEIGRLVFRAEKVRFLNNGNFGAEHVRVATENGKVFMPWIVNHAKAATAAEIARTTGGVMSVVKLFEYLD